MRLYLSAPMRGLPDENRPAFDAAAKSLRDAGHEVFNPQDLGDTMDPDATIRDFIGEDMNVLIGWADAVVQLEGWQNSRGAKAEYWTAMAIDLPVYALEDMMDGGKHVLK